MKYLRNFNQKLQDVRHQKKLTQEDVAMMCAVPESLVRNWEALEEGRREYPDVDQLIDFCVKASVPLEVLLDLDTSAGTERQLVLPGLDSEDDDDPATRMLGALAELGEELESRLPAEDERELLKRYRQCDDEKRTFIMQMLPRSSKPAAKAAASQTKGKSSRH
ncbi:helix-turn-helix domain-containing protein [Allohahella marinimesophila]|uniref:Helix-turn-helix protein n=1 Tax=Allohahella marinimesophila TaxID=1054972 RepID=A0ABP7NPE4_9GAMM